MRDIIGRGFLIDSRKLGDIAGASDTVLFQRYGISSSVDSVPSARVIRSVNNMAFVGFVLCSISGMDCNKPWTLSEFPNDIDVFAMIDKLFGTGVSEKIRSKCYALGWMVFESVI